MVILWSCLKHILSLGRWILGARRALGAEMEAASRELGAGVGGCCSSSQQGAVISASIPAAFPQAASDGTAQAETAASGNPEQAHYDDYCPLNSHLFFICVRLMKMSSLHRVLPRKVLHKKVLLKEQPQNHISSHQCTKTCFLLRAKWPELPTSLSCHGRRFLRNVSGTRKNEEVSATLFLWRWNISLKCLYLNKC